MIIAKNDPDYIFTCTKCKIPKPNKEFTKRNTGKRIRRYFSKCKPCQSENVKRWSKDSVKSKMYKLKKHFNLEYEDYLNILKRQNYSCAICNRKELDLNRKLAVDHNHDTGKIRGLLCNNCNRSLGYLYENINSMKNMIKYVKKHN